MPVGWRTIWALSTAILVSVADLARKTVVPPTAILAGEAVSPLRLSLALCAPALVCLPTARLHGSSSLLAPTTRWRMPRLTSQPPTFLRLGTRRTAASAPGAPPPFPSIAASAVPRSPKSHAEYISARSVPDCRRTSRRARP
ncbi:hypothetical protein FA95DRAFT_1559882 [Auriscalpium vulgare]|uniref:Uncharacterized protein n=1 Tax=Auriscalpium vulgare TaxID=40419 RepID=A0ACB8RQX3_9AGAM|nr:hypothetical protein FA95DRAFT_1559882 [Auriscalpium vulgare]